MNLKKFKFPKISLHLPTDKRLLAEAEKRGFYNGSTKYNALFSVLFFTGGSLTFKKDLDEDFRKNAFVYLKAFMGSFSPKHEEKEAICALLLSELVET